MLTFFTKFIKHIFLTDPDLEFWTRIISGQSAHFIWVSAGFDALLVSVRDPFYNFIWF